MTSAEKTALLTKIDEENKQQGMSPLAGEALEELTNFLVVEQAAIADIATPATATAEDCANKINAILAMLRTAGVIAAS